MQNQQSSRSQHWLRLSLIKKRSPAFWLALLDHFGLTVEQLVSRGAIDGRADPLSNDSVCQPQGSVSVA